MSKERPPVLSVLLDNERKAQFQQIAQSEGRSMGWVIKDMIDRVIAADSIHIYGESPAQSIATGSNPNKVSTEYVSMLVLTEYVDGAITPLSNDLVSLQSQLAEVKSDCDLTTEGIQRLIADAISKVSIATTTSKKPPSAAIRTVSAPYEDGGIEFQVFADAHGLTIKREDGVEAVRAALSSAGLTDRYRYNSKARKFFEVRTDGQ
jgi:hypothetical protein